MSAQKVSGRCLCGGVQFEVSDIHGVEACHCRMCQHWTGGPLFAADVRGGVEFKTDATLAWYESSVWAKRGFCSTCGSSLFYRLTSAPEPFWVVAAGSLELPQGLALSKEIFFDEKSGLYDLAGDRPRRTGREVIAEFRAALETRNTGASHE